MLDSKRIGMWLAMLAPLGAHAQGVTVGLSQRYAQLTPGQTLKLAASVSGSGNGGVTWQVDNVNGGTPSTGTVSADGVFTAPASVPTLASATITAVSAADPTASATSTVTLLSQAPAGGTFYVSPNGGDTNPGTAENPFRTIQHAAGLAKAGDTVLVHQGTYGELISPAASGSPQAYITISAYPGETATIDGTGLPIPNGEAGLITLKNASYVIVQGFEVRNYTTASRNFTPVGIFMSGGGAGVQLVNNHVHDITTTAKTSPSNCASNNPSANALGVLVYGNNPSTAIANLVVSGNEIDHLKTDCSESLSLDGNVDGFAVTSNMVHDNDNIGIDAIGFEGVSSNPATDQARNGEISGNTVFGVTSYGNPGYGKQYASDGIYVDGGTAIVIEQNVLHNDDFGIELASEHNGRVTGNVIARNNVIYDNNASGITIGGYGPARGGTDHCSVVNNTLYGNATQGRTQGEFQVQFNATNNIFENNIVYAGPTGLIVNAFTKPSAEPTRLDHNLYFSPLSAGKSRFIYSAATYASFAKYQMTTGQDAHSTFADPLFDSVTSPVLLDVKPASPAFGLGTDPGAAVIGAVDITGAARVQGNALTAGAYEL